MKYFFTTLFAITLFASPCSAQFGGIVKKIKSAKTFMKGNKKKDIGDTPIIPRLPYAAVDTTSVEYKKAMQEMYDRNPELKKLMEMGNDTVALKEYYETKYGGMTPEEIRNAKLKDVGLDLEDKTYKDAIEQSQKMSKLHEDPIFLKVMSENRTLTKEEAMYLNEKYGVECEYDGMESYNDSIGVFACHGGEMVSMDITYKDTITDERPAIDFGLDIIKQKTNEYLTCIKNPLSDRIVVDNLQNYMVFKNRHSDERFKKTARFTIYSNTQTDITKWTHNDVLLRQVGKFTDKINPENIFVFKVHKGVGCRYMEYKYSKITYKLSELNGYISERLVAGGYIDTEMNQKKSDKDVFCQIDNLEMQFKLEKLLKAMQGSDKFIYTNKIEPAKGVNVKSVLRGVSIYVNAIDLEIEGEPGEYAFVIREPEVEETLLQLEDEKGKKLLQPIDLSILDNGVFFFTIE